MAVYRFRMQKVLDLKEMLESEKKNEMALAAKRLENEKDKMLLLENELKNYSGEFEENTTKGIQVDRLKVILDSIEYYKRSIKSQAVRIKMAQDYLETCRQELIKATQEKKMLEKLKEIDYKKYLYNEQKKEDKVVDDLVSFKESK